MREVIEIIAAIVVVGAIAHLSNRLRNIEEHLNDIKRAQWPQYKKHLEEEESREIKTLIDSEKVRKKKT